MAIQIMVLDPNAQAYTDDEIVGKVNAASDDITRAASVSAAARPIEDDEVTAAKVADGVAKANLDAMAPTARGYVQVVAEIGDFIITSVKRNAAGKLSFEYDDAPVEE